MRRKRFKKRPPAKQDMALQITSMADIFTIILVFLLKSYSSGAAGLALNQDIVLPQAKGGKEPVEALKLEVGPKLVMIEGSPAAKLENFSFASDDLDPSGYSKSLEGQFARQRGRQLASVSAAPGGTEAKPDPRLVLVVDSKTPYSTLKTVFASAVKQGYSDYKIVVLKEE